jgi:hypothetical protein
VTAVRLTGEPLDWSRADNEGAFPLALPGRPSVVPSRMKLRRWLPGNQHGFLRTDLVVTAIVPAMRGLASNLKAHGSDAVVGHGSWSMTFCTTC